MKQSVNFVAGQLTHELNSDRMFFKPFSLGLFLGGAFFALAKGHEFLRFFDDIFKLKCFLYLLSKYYHVQSGQKN